MALWARGFGGRRLQQATAATLRASDRFYGGMLGGDASVAPGLRAGVFLGAGHADTEIDLDYGGVDGRAVFGGAFLRYAAGSWYVQGALQGALQGGHLHHDTTRRYNNNLASGGFETATGTYDGWYLSPEIAGGVRIGLGEAGGASDTLAPQLSVRYLRASLDAYSEAGSTANLTVGRRTLQNVEERAELRLTRADAIGDRAVLLTSVYGGGLGIQRVGERTVDSTLLGQDTPFATPGRDGVWGGFGGAAVEWRNGRVGLFLAGDYTSFNDASSVVVGRSGVRVAF